MGKHSFTKYYNEKSLVVCLKNGSEIEEVTVFFSTVYIPMSKLYSTALIIKTVHFII